MLFIMKTEAVIRYLAEIVAFPSDSKMNDLFPHPNKYPVAILAHSAVKFQLCDHS